jgi:uncharacterized protein (DUF1330 family)
MHLIDQVNPTKEQFTILAKNYPRNEPVTMINLIKFRDKAWDGERTGAQAYECYRNNLHQFIKEVKGRLIWKGECMHTVIGDPQDQPHVVMLVEYPSIDNFLEMLDNPEYQKCANDRTMALEYGGLIASKTTYPK